MTGAGEVIVVPTGVANLASMLAGLRRVGAHPRVSRDPDAVARADRLVLPGVGTFGAAMASLEEGGLVEPLRARIAAHRPTLAVCVGHQIMFDASEESPEVAGLGIFPGSITRFPRTVRVPKLHWSRVALAQDSSTSDRGTPLPSREGVGGGGGSTRSERALAGTLHSGYALFANSFAAMTAPDGVAVALADHGGAFIAAIEQGHVTGLQFHPELSGAWGHRVLARWLAAGHLGLRSMTAKERAEVARGQTLRVIPCLDCRDGRVVKGVRFQNLRDSGDPVELAAAYETQGADEIVLLDISATPRGRSHHLETVRAVRERLSIPLTCGGGVRGVADVQALLEAGADMVALNTAAVARPDLLGEIAGRFGSQCTVLSLDAAAVAEGGWRVVVRSGTEATGLDAVAWALEAQRLGAGEILLTSWDRDGTRSGYDVGLIEAVASAVHVPVIASGGAAGAGHFADALRAGADAVLAASVFHDGDTTVGAVKGVLARGGFAVRP